MAYRPLPSKIGNLIGTGLFLGLAAVLLLFIASGLIAYYNTRALRRSADQITHTSDVLSVLDRVISLAKDAETGQRGFIITGDERYLEPYHVAVGNIFNELDEFERLTLDNPNQQARVPRLRAAVKTKLAELSQTIDLRRDGGFEAARDVILTNRGQSAMDSIRTQVENMRQEERELRILRDADMEHAYWVAVGSGVFAGLLGAVLSAIVTILLRQAVLNRQRQEWLQEGQIALSQVMGGEQSLDELGQNVLKFLVAQLDAHAGALFVAEGAGFRRVATHGVSAADGTPERFELGDGLLGQAAKDRRAIMVRNVPHGYLTISSALGHGSPRHLMIVPAVDNNQVTAVVELGFIHRLERSMSELLDRAGESISVAIRSVNYRAHLQNLLEETQRQAEELQAQSEELRVSNEELQEQSHALRESQTRLQNQQAELEQINSELERQSQMLEVQRDQASRANTALAAQARELEVASQYKSDFLANMSHELRTPLNSSLILAKLLADNPHGNLTAEQVQYAETIRTAGNDLLTLINDILDLSKIEAGHMELHVERVRIEHLVEDLQRAFRPIADQKQLQLNTRLLPNCPELIKTDLQRLEQVLRNLLSNALKFTEQGEVELTVAGAADGRVAFAVRDTGIGIPADQHEVIFKAFRQADSTASRRFGGTGLGLSISEELVRLLGGEIHLSSEPSQGSTFTVVVPLELDPSQAHPRLASTVVRGAASASPVQTPGGEQPSSGSRRAPAPRGSTSERAIEDDRERLDVHARVLLVVEDDLAFARILYDLAHELDFQCLVATAAEEAVATALEYLPSAVVLDVGLPDHSGLWVLDRLKHEKRTRHVPVHIISAGDYAQTALSLGAVGYMLKPVKRDELSDALRQLESRLAQRMGRVLVVEDDPVQLDSLRRLLAAQDVEAVGASSAAECLERLRNSTFDCMVLDLSLPDASGYSLLETLSREHAYSFPPVIVYTGRSLSADEEQRLRRYSKSIIIKGAKSPERLLDEVTLFLHRVVSDLPPDQQRMLEKARSRDAAIEGRRILIVEDDVRNVFALTSMFEQRGAVVEIARNGREALEALNRLAATTPIDLVLMDVMMPEMDGIAAVKAIRERAQWARLPVIMLTAKAMQDDQERCLSAGANDYMAKPLDVEKLLSLVRVWISR